MWLHAWIPPVDFVCLLSAIVLTACYGCFGLLGTYLCVTVLLYPAALTSRVGAGSSSGYGNGISSGSAKQRWKAIAHRNSLATASRAIVFAVESAEERDRWVMELRHLASAAVSSATDDGNAVPVSTLPATTFVTPQPVTCFNWAPHEDTLMVSDDQDVMSPS